MLVRSINTLTAGVRPKLRAWVLGAVRLVVLVRSDCEELRGRNILMWTGLSLNNRERERERERENGGRNEQRERRNEGERGNAWSCVVQAVATEVFILSVLQGKSE